MDSSRDTQRLAEIDKYDDPIVRIDLRTRRNSDILSEMHAAFMAGSCPGLKTVAVTLRWMWVAVGACFVVVGMIVEKML